MNRAERVAPLPGGVYRLLLDDRGRVEALLAEPPARYGVGAGRADRRLAHRRGAAVAAALRMPAIPAQRLLRGLSHALLRGRSEPPLRRAGGPAGRWGDGT
ncbi:MAG: hypothetical protein U5L11_14840 [Arhodomonas sp.]|nr:hypothetical protein [Arhodomonas sp.]